MIGRSGIVGLVCLVLLGCAATDERSAPAVRTGATMDRIAEGYVKLVLAVGPHDADYVDAYYGPPEWREGVEAEQRGLGAIRKEADLLLGKLTRIDVSADEEIVRLRHAYLTRQLHALAARVELLGGRAMSFDEESQALYDAVAPTHTDEEFERMLAELDPLLPGSGSIAERYETFRERFVIPPDRLDAVFRAAITACRERTTQYVDLPPEESFEVEYVTDKSWSAYNWYQGGYRSLIQVNTELPIYIDRAIDLACHEGYPGHHVYNVLLEKHLVRDRGWQEFTVYPLFSPQSLIAEGTANYGIEVAFPGDERVEFEKANLFASAGLDPATAELYYRVMAVVDELQYSGNEAARRYLDGEIEGPAAVEHMMRFGLRTRARAEQRLRFVDQYRSYVINYNLGQDLVRAYVGGRAAGPEQVWSEFAALISSPRLPSGLQ